MWHIDAPLEISQTEQESFGSAVKFLFVLHKIHEFYNNEYREAHSFKESVEEA